MHLISQLKSHNIVKYGQFTLKSGQTSDIYFNFKSLIHYPTLFANICYQLSKFIKLDDIAIAGVPLGGIPFATLVSYMLSKPMVLIRQDQKEYGMQQQVEGDYNNIVLIEDVCTSGASILNTIDILRQHDIHVVQIIILLDRQSGGVEKLKQLGYQIDCLYQLQDFTTPLIPTLFQSNDMIEKLLSITHHKQSNIIASLDCDDIFDIIPLIGPHVCAIKIHGDIFNNLNLKLLNDLKQQYHFLIIEDRKLSDITSICLKQVVNIKQYADMVTVHGLCGQSMIEEVSKQLPVIIVCNMSIKNNLIDQTYINKVLDIKCDNLVGYVSQYKIDNYLTFTPGIHMNMNNDNLDQTYHLPAQMQSDFYIIGRGIYEGDVLQKTIMYKNLCYKNDDDK
jgi:uridine monophosphate synthetase